MRVTFSVFASVFAILATLCVGHIAVGQPFSWQEKDISFDGSSVGALVLQAAGTQVVWAAGYDGTGLIGTSTEFSRSTDAGLTWTNGSISGATLGFSIVDISAVSATTAFASMTNISTGGGQIFRTLNGGSIWTLQNATAFAGTGAYLNALRMSSSTTGIAMGDPVNGEFEIYRTTNGSTWTAVSGANIPNPLAGEVGIVNTLRVAGQNAWFPTTEGRIFRSTNGGASWQVSSTPVSASLRIEFNGQYGLAVPNTATPVRPINVLYSADGGVSWQARNGRGPVFNTDIAAVPGSASTFVAVGSAPGNTGSSYTIDGGANWILIDTLVQHTSVAMASSTVGYAGGFTSATSPFSGGVFVAIPPTSGYCTSGLGGGLCNIASVAMVGTTLNTTTSLCSGSFYSLYPANGSTTGTLAINSDYTLNVGLSTTGYTVSAWFDVNNDNQFGSNEYVSLTVNGTQASTIITILPGSVTGPIRMRLRTRATGSNNGSTDACTEFLSGETRDYVITVAPEANPNTSDPAPYCEPQHTNGCNNTEITNVRTNGSGNLNNTSSCQLNQNGLPYFKYPWGASTADTLRAGRPYTISATTATSGIVSAWFDYNRNNVFDASEWVQVYTTGVSGSATFTVPAGTTAGFISMRVRSRVAANVNGANDACTAFASGETEDYTIWIQAAPIPPTRTNTPALATRLHTATSTNSVNPLGIMVDSASNTLVVGQYKTQGTFGSNVFNTASTGDGSGFIAKYSPGNQVLWAINVSSTTSTDACAVAGIAPDYAGGYYFVGQYRGSCRVGTTALPLANNTSSFVGRVSSAGTISWLRTMVSGSSSVYNALAAIATDRQGNWYATGDMIGTFNFNGFNLPSTGAQTGFILKGNAAGLGVDAFATTEGDLSLFNNISVDNQSPPRLYASGAYVGTIGGQIASGADPDGYLYVLSSADMSLLKTTTFNGTDYNEIRSHANAAGQVSVTIDAKSALAIHDGAAVVNVALDPDSAQIVVCRYTGGTLSWVRKSSSIWQNAAQGIVTDDAGNAFAAISAIGNLRFDSLSVSPNSNAVSAALVKFSATGRPVYISQPINAGLNGSNGLVTGLAGTDKPLLGGQFETSIAFAAENGGTLSRPATDGMYVVHFGGACTLAAPVISGPASVCLGSGIALRATGVPTGTTTYAWAGPNNFRSADAAPQIANATAAAAGSYSLTITSQGCIATSNTIAITITQPAVPTASGAERCGPGTLSLSAAGAPAGAGAYQWYATQTGGTAIGTGSPFATPSLAASTTYYVGYVLSGCASTRTAAVATVNANPTITISPSGPISLCQGANTSLVANSTVANTSFVWSNGTANAQLDVTATGNFFATGTAPGNCRATSASVRVTVTPRPNTDFAYSAPALCLGSGTATPTISGAAGGVFAALGGLVVQPNTGAIDLATAQAGTYQVIYSIAGQCPGADTVGIILQQAPSAAFIYPANTACTNVAITLLPQLTGGGQSGTWSARPSGLILVATTGEVLPATSQPGLYTVRNLIAAAGGCAQVQYEDTIRINAVPTISLNIVRDSTACAGDTVVLRAQSNPASGIVWSNGNTGNTLLVRTSGIFSAVGNTAGGCTGTSGEVRITFAPQPAQPAISQGTGTGGSIILTSSSTTGNQWYLNGAPIPAATAETYTISSAVQNGIYTLVVAQGPCQSQTSAAVTVTFVGTKTSLATAGIMVYPNPTKGGRFSIKYPLGAAATKATLQNALGQIVQSQTLQPGTIILMGSSDLPKGPYLLMIGGEGMVVVVE